MKKKLWVTLLALVLVLTLPLLSGKVRADEEPQPSQDSGGVVEDDDSGMTMSKYVRVQPDGTYIIDLEAFATGHADISVETAPADIILVLDVSGSMADTMYSYTARTSQSYTYRNYDNTYYLQLFQF